MDAFVIKTPRVNGQLKPGTNTIVESPNAYAKHNTGALNKIKKLPGQRTLHDLNGVVSLEYIKNAVKKLGHANTAIDEKVSILKRLRSKQPSTEIIKSSGIGKLVRSIAKSTDSSANPEEEKFKHEATDLYKKWKKTIEKRVELACNAKDIEVDYDDTTKNLRTNAISLMKNALRPKKGSTPKASDQNLSTSEIDAEVLKAMEKYLFEFYGRKVNTKYRKMIRRIVFDIQYNKGSIREQLSMINNSFRKEEINKSDLLKQSISKILKNYANK